MHDRILTPPASSSSGRADDLSELASLLARGVRRFLETSRPNAVSSATTQQIGLDVSRPKRTHVFEHEAP